jgi:hypothetical protein
MPRIGVEAVADQWETRHPGELAFATGRVLNMLARQGARPIGADGKPRILGAGPLSFELIEPFEHWRSVDGMATETTTGRHRLEGEPAQHR